MESVYIHIPFCKNICSYCDFCKLYYNGSFVTRYLNALINEIQDKYLGEEVRTLYIGGGTPSALSVKELNYLFEIIHKFNLSNLEEFSFECNLEDITEELLTILKNNGVDRLSIGIQSFNPKKLEFMERNHSFDDAKDKFKLMRKMGFDNINIDFMYGIPGETLKDLKKDFDTILKLEPDHISAYSLIVEDNTKIANKGVIPIPEELDASMYEYICDKLNSKKYVHYEISNFALKGHQCKHNLTYWNNDEYYGFGLGAHGYLGELRYENTRSFNTYLNGNYRFNEFVVSKQEDMENFVILGLRKLNGIDILEFFNKYKSNIQDEFNITELLKDGYLKLEGSHLCIPEDYIYIMNWVLNKILN